MDFSEKIESKLKQIQALSTMTNTSSLGSLTRPLGVTFGKQKEMKSMPKKKKLKTQKTKEKIKISLTDKINKKKKRSKTKSVGKKIKKKKFTSKNNKRTFTKKFESTKKAFEFAKKKIGKKSYW